MRSEPTQHKKNIIGYPKRVIYKTAESLGAAIFDEMGAVTVVGIQCHDKETCISLCVNLCIITHVVNSQLMEKLGPKHWLVPLVNCLFSTCKFPKIKLKYIKGSQ